VLELNDSNFYDGTAAYGGHMLIWTYNKIFLNNINFTKGFAYWGGNFFE